MTIQEKVKAYYEANFKAEFYKENCNGVGFKDVVDIIEDIFPELKELENEKTKKELVAFLKETIEYGGVSPEIWTMDNAKKWIDCLEKQGEQEYIDPDILIQQRVDALANIVAEQQTPADKVEPKFKQGKWIVWNDKCYKVNYNGCGYELFDQNGLSTSWAYATIEDNAHLWTIKDVKNGDVVVDKSDGVIGIFESIGHHPDGGSYNDHSYCFLHCRYDDGFFYADFENGNTIDSDDLIPATKEQYDLLFKKMQEAGYEFDTEKNELIKIKQKPVDKVEPKFHEGDWTVSNLDKKARQISEVHFDEYNSYYVIDGKFVNLEEYDRLHHLWILKDAKDGDVLSAYECIVLFKEIDGLNIKCYCSFYYRGVNPSFYTDTLHNKDAFCPATKEQCDLLFQKMKEAGYEWNRERLELQKIGEDYCKKHCKGYQETGKCFADGKCQANRDTEHKFNVGDWITDGYFHNKITDVLEDRYIVDTKFGKRSAILFNHESRYHLWTINDAKDGDILVESKGDVILMFRGIGNTEWDDVIDYHCYYGYYNCSLGDFVVQEDLDYWGNIDNNQLKPATKEQRDTLFKAMTDAGWEFDFKKNELNKIAQKSFWSRYDEQNLNAALSYINDKSLCRWLKDIIHVKYDKSTWSEEDERIRNWLIDTIKQVPNDSIEWETIDKSSILAWLEKQC